MADLVTNTDWPAKKPYNTVSADLIAWTPAIRANDRFAHRRQILGEFRGFNQHPYYYWPTLSAGRSRLGRLLSATRSEEHTSELQSRGHLVCRLLPAKKKPPSYAT